MKTDRYLRNIDISAGLTIVLVLVICALAVLPDTWPLGPFFSDARHVKDWCASRSEFDQMCLSFWYRTLADPSVAWNFWYSVLTFSLVIGAVITVYNDRLQRADTQKFFALDQRPWIRVEIACKTEISTDSDNMSIKAVIRLENVGKSPAFQVTRGWLYVLHPSRNMQEFWHRTRSDIDQRMDYMGITLLPGEKLEHECTIDVPAAEIETSRTVPGLATGLTVVSYKYKSHFSSDLHESSRMYCVFVGGGMPLHMINDLYREQQGITTSPLGVFEIAS